MGMFPNNVIGSSSEITSYTVNYVAFETIEFLRQLVSKQAVLIFGFRS